MFKIYTEKLKEAVYSIVPVMIIMMIIGIFLGLNIVTLISILFSTVLLIAGVSFFTLGASLSMKLVFTYVSHPQILK